MSVNQRHIRALIRLRKTCLGYHIWWSGTVEYLLCEGLKLTNINLGKSWQNGHLHKRMLRIR
jgi:hypothetical protein